MICGRDETNKAKQGETTSNARPIVYPPIEQHPLDALDDPTRVIRPDPAEPAVREYVENHQIKGKVK